MYCVNFLPWREQLLHKRFVFWCCLFLLQIFMLLALFIGLWQQLTRYQIKQNMLDLHLRQQKAVLTQEYQKLQATYADWMQKKAQIAKYQTQRQINQRYVSLLEKITAILPETMWLISLEANIDQISLSGRSLQYREIIFFEQQLSAWPAVTDLRLQQISYNREGFFGFHLQARWRQDEM